MLVRHADLPPGRVIPRHFPNIVCDLGGNVLGGVDPVLALGLQFLQQDGVDVFLGSATSSNVHNEAVRKKNKPEGKNNMFAASSWACPWEG